MRLHVWMIRVASLVLLFGILVSFAPPAQAQSWSILAPIFDVQALAPNPYARSSGRSLEARVVAIALDSNLTTLESAISTEVFDDADRLVARSSSRTIPSSNSRQVITLFGPNQLLRLAAVVYTVRVMANQGGCGTRSDTLRLQV